MADRRFSDFIRNASDEEKAEVYSEVIDRACARQERTMSDELKRLAEEVLALGRDWLKDDDDHRAKLRRARQEFEAKANPQAILALIAERDSLREQTRWIPVSERLPDDGADVLLGYEHSARIARYDAKEDMFFDPYDQSVYNGPPMLRGWMMLPKPPEAT